MKKLIIAGANGFIARYITRHFSALGWEVVGLARRTEGLDENCRYVHWDGEILGDWAKEFDGCDAVINMAGSSVSCRHNEVNKKLIIDSRVITTRLIGEAIATCEQPPEVWMNASGVAVYKNIDTAPQSEDGEAGDDFMAEVVNLWEAEFYQADISKNVRRIALRTSLVMAMNEPGIAADYLVKISKLFLGGKLASGKQMVSWIYIEDYCRAIEWMLDHPEVSGPVNMATPEPVTNAEMMRRFCKAVKRPFGLPAAGWMVKIGAFVLGTEAELILKGMWVLPTKLQKHGFVFKHPEMKPWEW
ncbi:TIGR01777 family oxidoreductase [Akkermansiaceae bacterium]|nr:TIGR01777 family oxidoreductase [Akkermansiaceae bacterium]